MAKMLPLWLVQGMLKMGMSLPKPKQAVVRKY